MKARERKGSRGEKEEEDRGRNGGKEKTGERRERQDGKRKRGEGRRRKGRRE